MMNTWRKWPLGECAHNLDDQKLLCPVCDQPLRIVDTVCKFCGDDLCVAICRHCRTQYATRQPAGKTQIVPADPMQELERKILSLQNEINTLKQEINSRKITPAQNDVNSQETQATEAESDSIMNKYRYLIG